MAFTTAAISEAPRLSRYEATTRGSVIVARIVSHDEANVFSGSVHSGISTIRLRYRMVNPIVSLNPGRTRRRAMLRLATRRLAAASRLVDLVEGPAVGEVRLLRRLPAAERLVDGEERHVGELSLVLRGDGSIAGPVVMARRDLLAFGRIQILQVGFGHRPRALLVYVLVHHRNRRLGEDAERGGDDLDLVLGLGERKVGFVLPGQEDVADAALHERGGGPAGAGVQHRNVAVQLRDEVAGPGVASAR